MESFIRSIDLIIGVVFIKFCPPPKSETDFNCSTLELVRQPPITRVFSHFKAPAAFHSSRRTDIEWRLLIYLPQNNL